MAVNATENVKLGVCSVIFDGQNLGFTKGGVAVEVATTTHEIKVDQTGETPIGELVTGRTITAKVPLAETTLENLMAIMPGARMISDGVKATGSITFVNAPPVNGDKVTVGGTEFSFKTAPVGGTELAIPATLNAAAAALAAAITANISGLVATAAGAVVTLTARGPGADGNLPIVKAFATAANLTTANMSGGVNPTKAKVVVPTGVNINLLTVAKKLVLRPLGTTGADDLTIYKAMCPGAMNFSYTHDNERVYQADFKGYAQSNSDLFEIGDSGAV